MSEHLHRLIYCSRNRLQGSTAEISAQLQGILAASRRNNSKLAVTGALLYNAGNFAQILEGPLAAVSQTFERIQRDERHSEVTVVESGSVAERSFAEWAMAFSGKGDAEASPLATAAFDAVFAKAEGAGIQMLSVLKDLVVLEDDWVLLDAA